MEWVAPHIDIIIQQLESISGSVDEEMVDRLKAIYRAMSLIEPEGDDNVRELWLEVSRGRIQDFGDYEEFLEEGLVESYEEFEKYWLDEYPGKCKWYGFATAEYREEYFFYIDSRLVFSICETSESYQNDHWDCDHIYDFLDWLLERVTGETMKLKKDVEGYNDYLDKNLSCHKRTGRIARRKYWEILGRDAILLDKRLGSKRIDTLRKLVDELRSVDDPVTLKELSAGDYFRYCEVCYNANDYFSDAEADLSPIEKYRRMADNRDGGLCSVDPDSVPAFHDWYHSGKSAGAHPWEICRGGNSTHISFMVSDTREGWALWLAGSSVVRVEETVRMAVALYEKNIPVNLYQAEAILNMVTGKDFIGIVPDHVFPRYCHSFFPEEDRIIDFMNLGHEHREALIDNAFWYPLKRIMLA
jgi:hypothetical protein